MISIFVLFLTPLMWGEHLIVPAEFLNVPEFQLASQFLNQYARLLNMVQTEETNDKLQRAKEDGFSFIEGNDQTMKQLTGTENFNMTFSNGIYTAKWSSAGKKIVSCSFPANIGLLTFFNKPELENQLIDRLAKSSKNVDIINLPIRETSKLSKVSFSDFYVEDKGFYITPRLKHQLVFEPNKDDIHTCKLLIDSGHYKLESITNMMLSGYSKLSQHVNVIVNQYGYKSEKIMIPLSNLHKVLSEEGSIPYWGVETFDGMTLRGLWVWINDAGGFAHMLSVTMSINIVEPINAKLHCYLRLDNLKSLFEEYPEL